MKRIAPLFVVLVGVLVGAGALSAQSARVLNVPLYGQQTNMWCWAASGEMVMDYIGPRIHQGVQANNRFGRSDCTQVPVPSACVRGGWWENAKYRFAASKLWNRALTWSQVKAEINANRPIWYAWAWSGGGGHAMVATGYYEWYGYKWVLINNPWPPEQRFRIFGFIYTIPGGDRYWVTYNTWVAVAGDHSHWTDWYGIRRY